MVSCCVQTLDCRPRRSCLVCPPLFFQDDRSPWGGESYSRVQDKDGSVADLTMRGFRMRLVAYVMRLPPRRPQDLRGDFVRCLFMLLYWGRGDG